MGGLCNTLCASCSCFVRARQRSEEYKFSKILLLSARGCTDIWRKERQKNQSSRFPFGVFCPCTMTCLSLSLSLSCTLHINCSTPTTHGSLCKYASRPQARRNSPESPPCGRLACKLEAFVSGSVWGRLCEQCSVVTLRGVFFGCRLSSRDATLTCHAVASG